MRTSISYQNYPNLWDEILNCASPQVLHKVRLVNRALCSAVDRRTRHVILTSGGNPKDGPYGALVTAYDPTSGARTPAFPDMQLVKPCELCTCFGEHDAQDPTHQLESLLLLTRVVDVRGLMHYHFTLGSMGNVFLRLDTVRLTQDAEGNAFPYQPFDAPTLVLFPSPAGLRSCQKHKACKQLIDPEWFDTDSDDDSWASDPPVWPAPPRPPKALQAMLPAFHTGEIRPGTTRVVVNMGGHVGNPATSFHCLYDLDERVEEIVFVLPRLSSLDDKGTVDAANPHELVEAMRSYTAKFIVVGAELLDGFAESVRAALKSLTFMITHPDVDYGIDDDLTRDMSKLNRSLYAARAKNLRDEHNLHADTFGKWEYGEPTLSLQEKVEDQLSRLKFVSVDEYRHRVGDETAALHLIQYASDQ